MTASKQIDLMLQLLQELQKSGWFRDDLNSALDSFIDNMSEYVIPRKNEIDKNIAITLIMEIIRQVAILINMQDNHEDTIPGDESVLTSKVIMQYLPEDVPLSTSLDAIRKTPYWKTVKSMSLTELLKLRACAKNKETEK